MAAQLDKRRTGRRRDAPGTLGDYPDEIGGYHGCRSSSPGSSLIMPGTVHHPGLRWRLRFKNGGPGVGPLAIMEAAYGVQT